MHKGTRSLGVVIPLVAGFAILCAGQMFAIAHGLMQQAQLPAPIAWFVAYVLAFIPLLGAVAGTACATIVWDWPVELSILTFMLPQLGLFLLVVLTGAAKPTKEISSNSRTARQQEK